MDSINLTYIDLFIGFVISLIMFGIGLSLTMQNFKDILLHPKAILIGLTSQMLVLPLIAFVIAYFSGLSSELKVGFVILAACPGGTTSGFITYLFKGNIALSISLTTINSLLTLFSIPIIVNLALNFFMGVTTDFNLPFGGTAFDIFILTILPAALGVFVRYAFKKFAIAIRNPLKIILVVLLAIVVLVKFFAKEKDGGTGITSDDFWMIFPYVFLLNFASMLFGYIIGMRTYLGRRDSYSIAIEISVHNTNLAILVAGTLMQNQNMVKPALIYLMFSFWTAILYTFLVKRLNKLKLFGEFY